MKTTKIAILGKGNVGSALARGLARSYAAVQPIGNDQPAQRQAAAEAEVVIDATNAVDANMNLALGYTTSGAEELQKKLPRARVVKAFNTVFAQHMDSGKVGATPLTAFVAADDPAAKQTAVTLAKDIGFEAVDAGPLKNARLLEPLAYLNIQLGYVLGFGTQIGFKLARG